MGNNYVVTVKTPTGDKMGTLAKKSEAKTVEKFLTAIGIEHTIGKLSVRTVDLSGNKPKRELSPKQLANVERLKKANAKRRADNAKAAAKSSK